jgi:hypothetical protein
LEKSQQPIVSDPEQVVTETPSTPVPVPVKKVIKKRP